MDLKLLRAPWNGDLGLLKIGRGFEVPSGLIQDRFGVGLVVPRPQ